MLRYVDSCVGRECLPDGTEGRDYWQHYSERVRHLHNCKEAASVKYGEAYGYGVPAFEHLAYVTEEIEQRLFSAAWATHGSMLEDLGYTEPHHFFQLVSDILANKISVSLPQIP